MSKRIWAAFLALLMGWVCAQGPRSEARPPDLPVNPQVDCPEGRVTEVTTVTATAEPVAPALPDLSWIETLLPTMLTKTVQDIVWAPRRVESGARPEGTESANSEVRIERFRQAQRIFQLGLGYQQRGLLSKARTCFEETHLLSPDTRYGRLAMERLADLEKRTRDNGAAEEAEEGPAARPAGVEESNHENMKRQTAPLGTVPMDSY